MKQSTDRLRSNGLFYKHLPTLLLRHLTRDIFKRHLTADELCTLSLVYYAGKNGISLNELYYHFDCDKEYALDVIVTFAYHGIFESFNNGNTFIIRNQFMFYGFGCYINNTERQELFKSWQNIFEYRENEQEYEEKELDIEIPINRFDNGKTFEIVKQRGEVSDVRKPRKNRP